MILISAGMPKSGSTWYFRMTNDLLVKAGCSDTATVCRRYSLESILEYGMYLERPTPSSLMQLLVPVFLGHSYAVKTHAGSTKTLRLLARLGLVRPTYIYRDPRDAAVSALEHGERLRSQGVDGSFGCLRTMEEAIRFIATFLPAWDSWTSGVPQALILRYEELKANPLRELQRLDAHLRLALPKEALEDIVDKYTLDSKSTREAKKRVHFNRGETGRYRKRMTDYELDLCRREIGDWLSRMGYSEL